MYRVCVTGGRDFLDKNHVFEALDLFFQLVAFEVSILDIRIISGGATGADTLAIEWAKFNEVNYEVYPAKWKIFGKAAGPKRNREMAETAIDYLIAFPGNNGTRDMVSVCNKLKIPVLTSKEIFDIGLLYK